jgi:hypothetical protein
LKKCNTIYLKAVSMIYDLSSLLGADWLKNIDEIDPDIL